MKYALIRQDDNGFKTVIITSENKTTLDNLLKRFDSNPHKNTFWVQEINDNTNLNPKHNIK